MLMLTNNDREYIENSYKSFLSNLNCLLKKNNINSATDCYKILSNMLRKKLFSSEGVINFDTNFKYLSLPNMDYIGMQVIYGVCCCRHVSEFLNDIMSLLGFNTSLYYIFIDNKDSFHPCTPIDANHVTILLTKNLEEYIFAPMNNFLLKKETNNSLAPLNLDVSNLDMKSFLHFSDNNIQSISKVLKKYYHLQSIGINHIYD